MDDAQLSARRLRRLRFFFLSLSFLVITSLQFAGYWRGGNLNEHLLMWGIEVFVVFVLILVVFREAIQLNIHLKRQLVETNAQALRQAVLIQLSTRLSTAHQEEEICQLLIQGLQEVVRYANLEVFLIDRQLGSRARFSALPGGESDSGSREAQPRLVRVEIPLRAGQERLGGLLVEVDQARGISEADHSLMTSAANLTVVALANARLIQEQRRQRQEADEREATFQDREQKVFLLSEITRTALEALDYPSLLQALADQVAKAFTADGVVVLLLEQTSGRLVGEAAFGPLRPSVRSLEYDPEEMVLGKRVLDTGQSVAIQDAQISTFINPRLSTEIYSRSILALPLIADNQKLGVLLITYQVEHPFLQHEVVAAEQAARQIALAIAKGHALNLAQHRAQELDALQKATAALLSTLDLEKLLGQILDAAISAIPTAHRGSLHLIARDTGQLQVRALQGYTDSRIRAFSRAPSDSHTARSVRERKPLLVSAAQVEQVYGRGEPGAQIHEVVSAIIAPLLLGEETLGVISLESYRPHAFTSADLNLLVSFAATATTAIHNAQLHAEVQKQAITDMLTGLYNRRGFNELGRREVERALRFGRPLTAIMLDIDYFKNVNDLYGHLVGDKILVGMSSRFLQELRQIDLLGRYGGDEFVALLPETDLDSAVSVADRLRKVVADAAFTHGALPVKITLSAGVAAISAECKDLTNLIQKADAALYEAKRSGRDRVLTA